MTLGRHTKKTPNTGGVADGTRHLHKGSAIIHRRLKLPLFFLPVITNMGQLVHAADSWEVQYTGVDSAADNVPNYLRWDSAIDDDWDQPNDSFKLNSPTVGYMSVDRVTNPADNGKTGNIWIRDPVLSRAAGFTMDVGVEIQPNSEANAFSMTYLDYSGSFGVQLSPDAIKVGGLAPTDPGNTVAFNTTGAFHTYRMVEQPNSSTVSVYVDGNTHPIVTGAGNGNYAAGSSNYLLYPRVLIGDNSNDPSINADYILDFVQYRRGAYAPGQTMPAPLTRTLPAPPLPSANETWTTGYSGATGDPVNSGWTEAGGSVWTQQPGGVTRLNGTSNARMDTVPGWTNQTALTLEARIKVMPDSQPDAFNLVANDTTGDMALVLSPNKVTLEEAYSFVGQASVNMDTTDAFHTYRLTRDVDGLYWDLYIDNQPVAAIADQHSGGEEIGFSRVWFGDINFPTPANSPDVEISYIRWHQGANAPDSGLWNVNSNGNWATGTNWNGNLAPNAIDAVASFGTIITGAHTVTLSSGQTVGTLSFNSPVGYTITGSPITLAVSMGQAAISVASGSHVINSPIVLNSDTVISSAAGSGVALTGSMIATGRTITKTGAGTVQFQNVRAAALNVSAGTAQISAKGTPNSASGTSVVNSLAITAGASLDLSNNSLVIDYSGAVGTLVNDTRLLLMNGQLISSSADSHHMLGYADNETLGLASFGGQQVDSTSMLIKFTYGGDTNLDGKVDSNDFAALAQHFNSTSASWQSGDFNYDGIVNALDFNILASNFGQPALPAAILSGVTVPEPGCMVLIALAGAAATRRRSSRFSQCRGY